VLKKLYDIRERKQLDKTMSALKKIHYLSEEDYLQNELSATIKHEYIDGQIYAMAGASENHNRISMNIAFQLRLAARGGKCGVFMSDMKLRIPQSHVYYYPDVMLVCQRSEADNDYYKHQPCFIAEVLSKGTQATDKREKLLNYQKIASLRYYLMIDSSQKCVEYWQRDETGDWQTAVLEPGENLLIQCENFSTALTLDSIYEDVEL
jgi:Uma2 family endonuclease